MLWVKEYNSTYTIKLFQCILYVLVLHSLLVSTCKKYVFKCKFSKTSKYAKFSPPHNFKCFSEIVITLPKNFPREFPGIYSFYFFSVLFFHLYSSSFLACFSVYMKVHKHQIHAYLGLLSHSKERETSSIQKGNKIGSCKWQLRWPVQLFFKMKV